MAMKKALLPIVITLALVFSVVPTRCEGDSKVERWIVIVGGYDALYRNFPNTYYCYHAMKNFGIDPENNIQYLYWNLEWPPDGVDAASTKENVQWAIREWLRTNSDEDDIVFIYFSCHGGGFNNTFDEDGNPKLEGGRIDESGDEGNEHHTNGTWFGVDENLWIYGDWESPIYYWDDELAEDLDLVSYGSLTIIFQACKSENVSCFSGGFTDDLTGSNRIIITASNETWYSYIDHDTDGLSEFSEGFFDALYGYNTDVDRFGVYTYLDEPINADFDGNGFVSMQEAFQYAYDHDDARYAVGHLVDEDGNPIDESPWLDCDGDGLPTFKDGQDVLDFDQHSAVAYLNWIIGDIDNNGYVEMTDYYYLNEAYGSYPGHPKWDPRCDLNCDGWVEMLDYWVISQHYGEHW
jgi:hypothetical protein